MVKTFSDGTSLGWDKGKIDDWCVYSIENDQVSPPKDVDYFYDLLNIADKYGHERVYKDFVTIYDGINSPDPEQCHYENVTLVASTYPEEDRLFVEKVFTIFWMAMVSEWNYEIRTRNGKIPSKLKHRIKRLGVYTMLIKGESPEYSSTFMVKMGWKEINELCKEDGFNI